MNQLAMAHFCLYRYLELYKTRHTLDADAYLFTTFVYGIVYGSVFIHNWYSKLLEPFAR